MTSARLEWKCAEPIWELAGSPCSPVRGPFRAVEPCHGTDARNSFGWAQETTIGWPPETASKPLYTRLS